MLGWYWVEGSQGQLTGILFFSPLDLDLNHVWIGIEF